MKIKDMYDNTESLNFDLVDDLLFYMRNESKFYRNYYFPVLNLISLRLKKNSSYNYRKILNTLVKVAKHMYIKKYDIPEKFFTNEINDKIIEKILDEEMDNISNGEYL